MNRDNTENKTINQRDSNSNAGGIHIIAKPYGPICNLACDYCFYLEKKSLFSSDEQFKMTDTVLESFISNYISSQPTPVVEFVWQGGEPILAGLDFFKNALQLQKKYTGGKTVTNSLQTNGTLLTDEWCSFLKVNNFMVGISLDGPRDIHELHRRDRSGNGTFDAVIRGIKLLQKHRVDYNVLVCVTAESVQRPLEVYNFMKESGVEFIQFTPLVERLPDEKSLKTGLRFTEPKAHGADDNESAVTPWSVEPEDYGDFLIAIYEEWIRKDVGRIFVMNFEWALNAWIGNPSPVCIHAEQCGRSAAIEHNGDLYVCDHYVYKPFRLGNIAENSLIEMIEKSEQTGFGISKSSTLPDYCMECPVLKACNGGCPKHRFTLTPDGDPGLNYLCGGYKKFFTHIRKYLKALTTLLENNLPASMVMDAIDGPLVIKKETKSPDN